MFQPLELPLAKLRLVRREGVVNVWCILRKKYLVLTPEEWVRQHLVHFLIQQKGYPQARLASEYSISYNGLSKRCDIVVFSADGTPNIIIECKAPEVKLSKKTIYQIAQYNKVLKVQRLIISNGNDHFNCALDDSLSVLSFQSGIPFWSEIS